MDLNKIDLGELADALRKYNEQFSGGGFAASLLSGLIRQEAKDGMDIEIESQISWGDIERHFDEVLQATGLTVEPVRMDMIIFTGQEQIPSSQMRLNLSNGGTFVQYLTALSQGTLTPSQRYGLEGVANNLTLQLTNEYHLGDPTDESVLDLFRHLGQVIPRYRELGLGNSVEKLAEYLNMAREGYLREHVVVQRAHLFDEVGGENFGPSQWHRDSSPEGYRSRWDKALKALDEVSQNPRAEELSRRLRNHLMQSAQYALRDINKNPKRTYRQALTEIVEEVIQYLS